MKTNKIFKTEKHLNKFDLFFSEISKRENSKILKWKGRQIEYRGYGDLSKNQEVFTGRVVKILNFNEVIVKVSSVSAFNVTSYSIMLPTNNIDSSYRRKIIYKKNGPKFKISTSIKKDIYHIVRYGNCRWKQIYDSNHPLTKKIINEFLHESQNLIETLFQFFNYKI